MLFDKIGDKLKLVGYSIADKISPVSKETVIAHMKAATIEARQDMVRQTREVAQKSVEELQALIVDFYTQHQDDEKITKGQSLEDYLAENLAYWAEQKQKTEEDWQQEMDAVAKEAEQEYEALKDDPIFLENVAFEQHNFRSDREYDRQQQI